MANNQIPGSCTLTEWYMGEPFEQCTQHIIRVCAIKRVLGLDLGEWSN